MKNIYFDKGTGKYKVMFWAKGRMEYLGSCLLKKDAVKLLQESDGYIESMKIKISAEGWATMPNGRKVLTSQNQFVYAIHENKVIPCIVKRNHIIDEKHYSQVIITLTDKVNYTIWDNPLYTDKDHAIKVLTKEYNKCIV